MHPPTRGTRTTNNPGLVDLPNSRRVPAEVAAEKQKKKQTAEAKARAKTAKLARVARVEKEIRIAQKEATQGSQQLGKQGRVKKVFQCETPVDKDDRASHPDHVPVTTQSPSPTLKRKASMAQTPDEIKHPRSTKAAKIILLSDEEDAPSTSQSTVTMPRGLATTGPHTRTVNTVIDDFDYQPEGSGSDLEEEGDEDDLQYPGDMGESLVSIKLADAPKVAGQSTKSPRPGVRSLPANVRRSFSEDFIPSVLEEVGWSTTPWQNLDVNTLQICINQIYPTLGYVVEKGDAIDSSANARVMSFRNIIGAEALTNVQVFLKRFKGPEKVEAYVKSGMIYYGEIPFLYKSFEPTAVRLRAERGGYKVERHGLFKNPAILDTVLVYYGKRGVKQYLPTASSPGSDPYGMLALTCTAVERALLMHSTGSFIDDRRPFSEKNWGHRTVIYAKLAKDMNTVQWDSFYAGLSYAGEIQQKLKECSRPVEHWTDNPDEYFIVGSDPVEEEEGEAASS